MARLGLAISCLVLVPACAEPAPAPTSSGCARDEARCEAACASREMPGSSEKEPAIRGELEEERCRERCRSEGKPCER